MSLEKGKSGRYTGKSETGQRGGLDITVFYHQTVLHQARVAQALDCMGLNVIIYLITWRNIINFMPPFLSLQVECHQMHFPPQ